MIKPKTITRDLLCELTPEQRREYGVRLSCLIGDMEDAQEEAKKTANQHKDRIAGIRSNIQTLSHRVRTGSEWRPVECRVELCRPDHDHKQVIRLDTLEVVTVERMSEDERQMNLFDKDGDGDNDFSAGPGDVIDLDAEDVSEAGDEDEDGEEDSGDDDDRVEAWWEQPVIDLLNHRSYAKFNSHLAELERTENEMNWRELLHRAIDAETNGSRRKTFLSRLRELHQDA